MVPKQYIKIITLFEHTSHFFCLIYIGLITLLMDLISNILIFCNVRKVYTEYEKPWGQKIQDNYKNATMLFLVLENNFFSLK